MTPAAIIKKYIELRDWLEADSKSVDERQKPYKDAMSLLENTMQEILNKDGADNIKTEFGTAYRTSLMSVRMADRAAFIDYIVKSQDDPFSYFTNAVSKEKIKDYIDKHGAAPAGIDVTTLLKTNFRRS